MGAFPNEALPKQSHGRAAASASRLAKALRQRTAHGFAGGVFHFTGLEFGVVTGGLSLHSMLALDAGIAIRATVQLSEALADLVKEERGQPSNAAEFDGQIDTGAP